MKDSLLSTAFLISGALHLVVLLLGPAPAVPERTPPLSLRIELTPPADEIQTGFHGPNMMHP